MTFFASSLASHHHSLIQFYTSTLFACDFAVPFAKITDFDIVEPAGNECIFIPRVLFKVRIDTASSGNGNRELVPAGLKDPHSFQKLVWAMKRNSGRNHAPKEEPAASQVGFQNGNESNTIATLLTEIRDELRNNNATLQTFKKDENYAHVVDPKEAPY